MVTPLKCVSTVLAFAAALLLTDLHWCAMQSITWANMIGDSNRSTFSERVSEVLSGTSPCEHCDALQKGIDSEGEQLLEMITKTVTISPVSISSVSPVRNSALLFNLAKPQLRASQCEKAGIKRPPRIA